MNLVYGLTLHEFSVAQVSSIHASVNESFKFNGRFDVEFDVKNKESHFISINDRNVYRNSRNRQDDHVHEHLTDCVHQYSTKSKR